MPAAFVVGSCAIIIAFDNIPSYLTLTASELDFLFWPEVHLLARRIIGRCVGQGFGRMWGGYDTGTVEDGRMSHSYKVMVEGWVYNVYTPHGRLET